MNQAIISAIILISTVWIAAYMVLKGRKGRLQVYPFVIILRLGLTLKPRDGKSRIASIAGWAAVALLSIAVAFFYFEVGTLVYYKYINPAPEASSAGLVPFIPGITVPWSKMPYFLLALGIAVLIHEISHALMARYEGLPVKNAGLALIAFIPAAFVEVDEDQLASSPLSSRLKVYSAGVASNLILGLLLLGVVASGCGLLSNGVKVIDVEEGSPAWEAGIRPGDVITGVNGLETSCIDVFIDAMRDLGVGDPSVSSTFTLTVQRSGTELEFTVTKPSGVEYIGIKIINQYTLAGLIVYPLQMLNIALALINAAPLFITDGGRVLGDVMSRLAGDRGRVLSTGIQAATLLLILSLITITPILPG